MPETKFINNGQGQICGDCSLSSASDFQGKYCGNGECNIFGCSCDGGCRSIPETSSNDQQAIQNFCYVDACTEIGLNPYCGRQVGSSSQIGYTPEPPITPGSPLYSYCEAQNPQNPCFADPACNGLGKRRLLQDTSNDTSALTLTPYELCTENLISELNTISFTKKEDILANFKCLSMANPKSLKITKQEACTAVGEEICANVEFDALFGEDNLAMLEAFDASLKGVDVTSAGSSLSTLASCAIAFILYIAL